MSEYREHSHGQNQICVTLSARVQFRNASMIEEYEGAWLARGRKNGQDLVFVIPDSLVLESGFSGISKGERLCVVFNPAKKQNGRMIAQQLFPEPY